jgi:MFS family permease
VMMTLFSPFAGRLSDRMEPGIVASIGMGVTTIGLLLFIPLHEQSSLLFISGNLVLLGFGFALFSSPNTNAIMGSVEKRFYGIASGAVGTMRLLGMMISMGITTCIFTTYIGRVQINPASHLAFMKGFKTAFIIFSLFCFGGVFASLVRGKLRPGTAEMKSMRSERKSKNSS